MREIKFRAFYDGAMYDVTELFWSNETAYIAKPNSDDGETVDLSKIILMQFTGLKDKNGKEIYEGDVIHRNKVHMVVFWVNNKAKCAVKYPNRWNTLYKGSTMRKSLPFAHEGEVIGNIYEHPNLLTNEK